MSEEIEALGTAVEGSLLARAVDDEGNIITAEGKVAGHCLNCDAPVVGNYCANCGQPLNIHRSFSAFWHDISHSVLHFDGKFWRTLPLLAWRPGELTRRYILGERAKFISPMALFLFSIFLMFAVFSFIGSPFSGVEDGGFSDNVAEESARLDAEITELEAEMAVPDLSRADADELREEIDDLKRGRNVMASITFDDLPYPEIDMSKNQVASGSITQSGDGVSGPVVQMDNSINTGYAGLDEQLHTAFESANKNPSLLLYKLKANGYKFAWLLIPISVPFMWLVMIGRRGYRFYDHAIFTTYSIAFMSLLFIFCALLAAIGVPAGIWALLLTLYPAFHVYRQLRHAYKLSRIEAFIRVQFLFVFTLFSLLIFIVVLFGLGVLG